MNVDAAPAWFYGLVAKAVSRCPGGVVDAVLRQAVQAWVVGETQGRTVDVGVPDDADPVRSPDGPLRPVPHVVSAAGETTGDLMVWVRDGRLIGLERSWWTDDAPTRWPTADEVVFPETTPT